jgi:acyl-CoA thioester hydrolase
VSGIIRWGTYVRFVEMAETELFRAAGFPYATLWDRLDIWLPRVQFHLDYRNPARLDELLDIEIWVGRIGRSSIRLEFAVKKPGGDLAAEGYLVIVSIDRKNAKSVDVPKLLLDALAPYTHPSPRPSPARGEGVLAALPESKVISKTPPDFYFQAALQADEGQIFPPP